MMHSKNILGKAVAGISFLILLGYIVFRAMPLVLGPSLLVEAPVENQLIRGDSIDMIIHTNRAVEMFVSGNEIPIDISNTTHYRYYLTSGIQSINIEVFDIYGKSKKVSRSVIKK